jgi:hypothetical protein
MAESVRRCTYERRDDGFRKHRAAGDGQAPPRSSVTPHRHCPPAGNHAPPARALQFDQRILRRASFAETTNRETT